MEQVEIRIDGHQGFDVVAFLNRAVVYKAVQRMGLVKITEAAATIEFEDVEHGQVAGNA